MIQTGIDEQFLTAGQGRLLRIRLRDGTELRPGVLTRYDDHCLVLQHVESSTLFLVYRSAVAVMEEYNPAPGTG